MTSLLFSALLLFQLSSTQTDWTGGRGVVGPVSDFGTAFYGSDSMNYNVSGQISPVASSSNPGGWIKHTVERNPSIDGHGGLYPADFDGDGDLDLAGWMTLSSTMRFYRNFKVESDSVGYQAAATYASPPGSRGKYGQTWAGDINGDGKPDVAVACSTRVFWYENLGSFNFTLHDLGPAIHTSGAVEGADINRDGLVDLVVGDRPLEVWYQEPGGTFRRQTVWTGKSYKILVGNINGDSWPDLMAEDQVFLNDNGTFPSSPTWGAGLLGPDGIWIRDFNNDNLADVLVSDQWASTPGIYWYENLGNGTSFRQHTVYKRAFAQRYGDGASAEDVDGDGKADVVGSYSRVGFFRQITPDSFTLTELDTITDSHWIRTQNLDYKPNGSDADIDILVTGRGQFAWYENDVQVRFSSNGWLVSSILDAGFPAAWKWLAWDAARPVGTQLDLYVRTGATPAQCTTNVWSGPVSVQVGVQFDSTSLAPYIGQEARYFQYRVAMASNNGMNPGLTPAVRSIKVVFTDERDHDVGTVRINAPAQVGDTVSLFAPSADLFNYGTSPETFLARFIITHANGDPFYRDSTTVTLQPETGKTQLFRQVRFSQLGSYAVNCSTALAVDYYRANDVVTQATVVEGEPDHDVGTARIAAPTHVGDTMVSFIPSADLYNYGNSPETFLAHFVITFANGDPFYRDSAVVTLQPSAGWTQYFSLAKFRKLGHYVVSCSTALAVDEDRSNDAVTQMTKVATRPPWPDGWHEVASVPASPSGKAVKRGGWATFVAQQSRFYAAKGEKTGDFYTYFPVGDSWLRRASFPAGTSGRLPSTGSAATSDGNNLVYAVKGNNTLEFWSYDVTGDLWQRLPDVPLGVTRKKVKGGTDMAYVEKNDTGYVYLLKGTKNEFWRFNTVAQRWDAMPMAPAGVSIKWDKGSWLSYDGEQYIYAHKGKYSQLWKYDVAADAWSGEQLPGIPTFNRMTLRNKKAKEGSSAAWYNGGIYAIKGASTNEFWRYSAQDNEWIELDTVPQLGSTLRPTRVNAGGDISAFGQGVFFVLKGNRTFEFWRYTLNSEIVRPPEPRREGVTAGNVPMSDRWMSITPNPLTDGRATISYSLPSAAGATLAIYDAAGRPVLQSAILDRQSRITLDLHGLAAGSYFVRIEGTGAVVAGRVMVSR